MGEGGCILRIMRGLILLLVLSLGTVGEARGADPPDCGKPGKPLCRDYDSEEASGDLKKVDRLIKKQKY